MIRNPLYTSADEELLLNDLLKDEEEEEGGGQDNVEDSGNDNSDPSLKETEYEEIDVEITDTNLKDGAFDIGFERQALGWRVKSLGSFTKHLCVKDLVTTVDGMSTSMIDFSFLTNTLHTEGAVKLTILRPKNSELLTASKGDMESKSLPQTGGNNPFSLDEVLSVISSSKGTSARGEKVPEKPSDDNLPKSEGSIKMKPEKSTKCDDEKSVKPQPGKCAQTTSVSNSSVKLKEWWSTSQKRKARDSVEETKEPTPGPSKETSREFRDEISLQLRSKYPKLSRFALVDVRNVPLNKEVLKNLENLYPHLVKKKSINWSSTADMEKTSPPPQQEQNRSASHSREGSVSKKSSIRLVPEVSWGHSSSSGSSDEDENYRPGKAIAPVTGGQGKQIKSVKKTMMKMKMMQGQGKAAVSQPPQKKLKTGQQTGVSCSKCNNTFKSPLELQYHSLRCDIQAQENLKLQSTSVNSENGATEENSASVAMEYQKLKKEFQQLKSDLRSSELGEQKMARIIRVLKKSLDDERMGNKEETDMLASANTKVIAERNSLEKERDRLKKERDDALLSVLLKDQEIQRVKGLVESQEQATKFLNGEVKKYTMMIKTLQIEMDADKVTIATLHKDVQDKLLQNHQMNQKLGSMRLSLAESAVSKPGDGNIIKHDGLHNITERLTNCEATGTKADVMLLKTKDFNELVDRYNELKDQLMNHFQPKTEAGKETANELCSDKYQDPKVLDENYLTNLGSSKASSSKKLPELKSINDSSTNNASCDKQDKKCYDMFGELIQDDEDKHERELKNLEEKNGDLMNMDLDDKCRSYLMKQNAELIKSLRVKSNQLNILRDEIQKVREIVRQMQTRCADIDALEAKNATLRDTVFSLKKFQKSANTRICGLSTNFEKLKKCTVEIDNVCVDNWKRQGKVIDFLKLERSKFDNKQLFDEIVKTHKSFNNANQEKIRAEFVKEEVAQLFKFKNTLLHFAFKEIQAAQKKFKDSQITPQLIPPPGGATVSSTSSDVPPLQNLLNMSMGNQPAQVMTPPCSTPETVIPGKNSGRPGHKLVTRIVPANRARKRALQVMGISRVPPNVSASGPMNQVVAGNTLPPNFLMSSPLPPAALGPGVRPTINRAPSMTGGGVAGAGQIRTLPGRPAAPVSGSHTSLPPVIGVGGRVIRGGHAVRVSTPTFPPPPPPPVVSPGAAVGQLLQVPGSLPVAVNSSLIRIAAPPAYTQTGQQQPVANFVFTQLPSTSQESRLDTELTVSNTMNSDQVVEDKKESEESAGVTIVDNSFKIRLPKRPTQPATTKPTTESDSSEVGVDPTNFGSSEEDKLYRMKKSKLIKLLEKKIINRSKVVFNNSKFIDQSHPATQAQSASGSNDGAALDDDDDIQITEETDPLFIGCMDSADAPVSGYDDIVADDYDSDDAGNDAEEVVAGDLSSFEEIIEEPRVVDNIATHDNNVTTDNEIATVHDNQGEEITLVCDETMEKSNSGAKKTVSHSQETVVEGDMPGDHENTGNVGGDNVDDDNPETLLDKGETFLQIGSVFTDSQPPKLDAANADNGETFLQIGSVFTDSQPPKLDAANADNAGETE